jgi:arginine/lysine/ornithine decarboxylase
MPDIKEIKKYCGEIPLLVDNAHGSHLKFIDMHPLDLGADICADSAHKTLPLVLTGGAMLHIKDNFCPKGSNKSLDYKDVKDGMSIFGSTSPSFLILISLEKCINWLKINGRKEFRKLVNKVNRIKHLAFESNLKILDSNSHRDIGEKINNNFFAVDPTRITFDFSRKNFKAKDFADYLRSHKIEPEFSDEKRVVLIPSPFNSKKDFKRLRHAIISAGNLNKFAEEKKDEDFYRSNFLNIKVPLRQAFFSKSEKISINRAAGRISSRAVFRCPPGIPILLPGEEICPEHIKIMKKNKIFEIFVLEPVHTF